MIEENASKKRKLITVSDFYKEKFGTKVYKLSLDAGCTCPNRDGTKSNKGCIFCSSKGSGDFTATRQKSITDQIVEAKALLSPKLKNSTTVKYIAYFQNFTSTYGNSEELIKKYEEAISQENVIGLAIATRPDCINQQILDYLSDLSKYFYVQLELGFQTSNEKTAEYINRCFTNEEYLSAVNKIKSASTKIHIVTHIIFGLPDETEKDMMDSVNFCVKAGTHGVKFTVLYVLKNTPLEKEYQMHKFKCLEMNEYFELLVKAINLIPENIVFHRFTGDGPKSILIDPWWTADKKNVHNQMKKYFLENGIII